MTNRPWKWARHWEWNVQSGDKLRQNNKCDNIFVCIFPALIRFSIATGVFLSSLLCGWWTNLIDYMVPLSEMDAFSVASKKGLLLAGAIAQKRIAIFSNRKFYIYAALWRFNHKRSQFTVWLKLFLFETNPAAFCVV